MTKSNTTHKINWCRLHLKHLQGKWTLTTLCRSRGGFWYFSRDRLCGFQIRFCQRSDSTLFKFCTKGLHATKKKWCFVIHLNSDTWRRTTLQTFRKARKRWLMLINTKAQTAGHQHKSITIKCPAKNTLDTGVSMRRYGHVWKGGKDQE